MIAKGLEAIPSLFSLCSPVSNPTSQQVKPKRFQRVQCPGLAAHISARGPAPWCPVRGQVLWLLVRPHAVLLLQRTGTFDTMLSIDVQRIPTDYNSVTAAHAASFRPAHEQRWFAFATLFLLYWNLHDCAGLRREEDYQKLNAQIEEQTAKLVAQAEQVRSCRDRIIVSLPWNCPTF